MIVATTTIQTILCCCYSYYAHNNDISHPAFHTKYNLISNISFYYEIEWTDEMLFHIETH